MKPIMTKWLAGWRILGRIIIAGVIWQLQMVLLLPLRLMIESDTAWLIAGISGDVLLSPLALFIAASASGLCIDVTEQAHADSEQLKSAQ
jgi:hypothetical protein